MKKAFNLIIIKVLAFIRFAVREFSRGVDLKIKALSRKLRLV